MPHSVGSARSGKTEAQVAYRLSKKGAIKRFLTSVTIIKGYSAVWVSFCFKKCKLFECLEESVVGLYIYMQTTPDASKM